MKFAKVVNDRKYYGKSFTEDLNEFCVMVRGLFTTNAVEVSRELDQLCHTMR